ncbi:low-affinity Cu transporter KNAG_0E00760 [Huiozyma naganishii CBS 8797]|uniref:Copper transport protein n=1 Tax=Huiozyma naganishii (strain ATCC MYA-139 / BCRC 22969 / CBS 8797 / KCTC 17520 / NBRC 10181 / NCYC 3082 / Yp74L-3) TaxID=1071383 RepID=J7S6E6_HUIN7|nr:hypothetical protein KNAG_0E00760 [Kazachstania naganishii CBS 8797]CCK70344.1 hypothetical protein KNAG_0E00760 [Kazachstania naganishii CBS 8797]
MPHEMPEGSCSMNMSFTWSYMNTCVIFHWWRITSLPGLLLSCLFLVQFSVLYEYMKYRLRSKNSRMARNKGRRSVFYGVQVGFSFLLMLVFMTYNGWLMLSVVVGAILGHYYFEPQQLESSGPLLGENSLACH